MILHLLTSDETKFDIIHELSCIQGRNLEYSRKGQERRKRNENKYKFNDI